MPIFEIYVDADSEMVLWVVGLFFTAAIEGVSKIRVSQLFLVGVTVEGNVPLIPGPAVPDPAVPGRRV